jgi:hypothetical protein
VTQFARDPDEVTEETYREHQEGRDGQDRAEDDRLEMTTGLAVDDPGP